MKGEGPQSICDEHRMNNSYPLLLFLGPYYLCRKEQDNALVSVKPAPEHDALAIGIVIIGSKHENGTGHQKPPMLYTYFNRLLSCCLIVNECPLFLRTGIVNDDTVYIARYLYSM